MFTDTEDTDTEDTDTEEPQPAGGVRPDEGTLFSCHLC